MNEETQATLERGPHPLPWTIAALLIAGVAMLLHSIILAGVAGLLLGFYEGHYHGRLKVLRAWRRDIEIDNEKLESELNSCDNSLA